MAKKFDMELLDSLKGVDVLDEVSEEKLEEMFDEIREYKKKREARREKNIARLFSEKCSLTVRVQGDEDNSHSGVEVSFKGCKGLPDIMLLGVATLASIADHFPEHKEELLKDICEMALLGEEGGVYRSKESMLKAEEEEE